LVRKMNNEDIVSILEDVRSKMKTALDLAKNIEEIDEDTVNKVVNLINEIVRMADKVADYVIGLLESEEL